MPANVDVVPREQECGEAILESGEGGDECVLFVVIQIPNSDFAILMSCEYLSVAKCYGFDGACVRSVGVKGVEEGVGDDLENLDFVAGGGVEEVVVDGQEMDVVGEGGQEDGGLRRRGENECLERGEGGKS